MKKIFLLLLAVLNAITSFGQITDTCLYKVMEDYKIGVIIVHVQKGVLQSMWQCRTSMISVAPEIFMHRTNDLTFLNLESGTPNQPLIPAIGQSIDFIESDRVIIDTIANQLYERKETRRIKDIDGNQYSTVRIGTQIWMAENLRTTTYRDGTPIPYVEDNKTWSGLTWGKVKTGAYCWYDNDSMKYKNIYGALYNWYAVVDSAGICPAGWHAPTDDEWTTLENYLGGNRMSGGKMKETGNDHWISPNMNATNECGFSGLPGGNRYNNGSFHSLGKDGTWWSSTETYAFTAWGRSLHYNYAHLSRSHDLTGLGFSVRCIKD